MKNNLLFITVEDVKKSSLWQPINDRKQSTYNDNLIYNSILKTSLWVDRLVGGTVSEKINKKELFPWVKKDGTGLIDYDRWLNYIQSACLLAVINWYLPKGVNDLTGSASISQGGVAYSQTNDPEANENITKDVKNALKLAGELIDTTSAKTFTRPYNYVLDNYAHPWEEEYKHISKKTFYPILLFWLKNRLYSDNSINITYPTKNDFSKIDYNEYIKLVVPFDNNTIYYDNGVWKAKQADVPSNVLTQEMLDPNYLYKSEADNLIKIKNGDNNLLTNTLLKSNNYNELNTSDKSVIGSINELKTDKQDNLTAEKLMQFFESDEFYLTEGKSKIGNGPFGANSPLVKEIVSTNQYSDLQTTVKTLIGAINELKSTPTGKDWVEIAHLTPKSSNFDIPDSKLNTRYQVVAEIYSGTSSYSNISFEFIRKWEKGPQHLFSYTVNISMHYSIVGQESNEIALEGQGLNLTWNDVYIYEWK